MAAYFRVRAIAAGVTAGVIALGGIAILEHDSPRLFDRLTGPALPLVVLSAICGIGALVMLVQHRAAVARVLAAGAVATVVGGWGVAQYPFLLGTHLTLEEAAAPDATLTAVLAVFGVAIVTCLPALILLYVLDQRGRLDTADH
jgi:cytochrome d ubiquinol oxidase subunit II